MRRLLYICSALAVSAALFSCNKADDRSAASEFGDSGARMTDVPILFYSGEEMTKGPNEVKTADLSSFYVTATTGSNTETAVSGFGSVTFSKSGSYFVGGKYWPSSDPGYHFYAASKALTFANNTCTFKPSATIADDVYAYRASNAYTSSNPPSPVALTFNHIYAQVGSCSVTKHSDISDCEISNLTVKITPKLPTANATFNVKTGAWSTTASHYTSGSAVTLCSALNSSVDNDLWLVPGSYTLTANYHIKLDGWEKDAQETATVNLEMGRNNLISGTIGRGENGAATIQFSVTVNPWSDNSIGDVTFD